MNWTKEQLDEHYRRLSQEPDQVLFHEGGISEYAIRETEDMSEATIEAECTKILEEDGWRALRTDPVSHRSRGKGFGELGMADHLYIRYANDNPYWRMSGGYRGDSPDFKPRQWAELLWIEFKRQRDHKAEKAKKHQIDWHAKERARGALTLIAGVDFPASVAGFTAWYAASGLPRAALSIGWRAW
jgi:hypothetical protein